MKNNNLNGKHQNLAQHTLDVLDDSVFWLDSEARFTMVNEGTCKNLGYSEEELLQMTVHDIDPQYPKEMWKESWDLIRAEKELVIDSTHIRKDGVIYPVQVRGKHIIFEGNEYVCGIARDISERIRTQESLKRSELKYRMLFEGANDAIFILEGVKFIECNLKTLDIFGVQKAEEIVGLSPWDFSPKFQPDGMDSREMALTLIKKTQAGKAQRFYWKHTKADGTEFDAEISLNRLEIGKKRNLLQAIVRDISDLVKTTDALKITEEATRALINATEDSALLIDPSSRIIELNNAAAKTDFGKDRGKLIGKIGFDEMPEELATYRKQKLNQMIQNKKPIKFEMEWDNRQHITSIYPILDRDGEVIQIAIFERDVTEEKNAAKNLFESEEKFSKVFHSSPVSIHITSIPDGRFVDVNPMFEKISGYKKNEIIGKSSMEMGFYIDTVDREALFKKLKTYGKLTEFEISFRIKSGDVRLCLLNSEIIDFKGQPHLLSMIRDITEHRHAEEALRESEERLRAFMNSATDSFYLLDNELNFIMVNKTGLQIMKRDLRDVVGKNIKVIVPDIVTSGRYAQHQEVMKTSKPFMIEDFIPHPEFGDKHFILKSFKVGNGLGVISVDITERKKAEQALQESEERYRMLIENIPSVVWKTNKQGKTSFISQNVEKIYGFTPKQIYKEASKLWIDRIHPEDRERILESFALLFEKGIEFNEEYRIQKKNGEWIWLFDRASHVNEENGEYYAYGVFSDITDRKKVEEELQESEQKYRSLFDDALDMIHIIDLEGKIIDVNKIELEKMLYQREEYIGKKLSDFIHPDYLKETVNELHKVFHGEPTLTYKTAFVKKNGEKIDVEVSAFPEVRDDKVVSARGILRDITEKTKAENAIRDSEERLKILFEFAPDAIYLNDLKGNFIDGNKASEELLGFKRKELVGKNLLKLPLLPKDQIMKAAKALVKNVAGKPTGPDEFTLRRKGGSETIVEIRTYPVKIKDQTIVLGIARDVSERKKIEEELRRSEDKFSKAFQASPSLMTITTWDEGRLVDVNSSFEINFGYSKAEALNKTSVEIGIYANSSERKKMVDELKANGRITNKVVPFTTRSGEMRICNLSSEIISVGDENLILSVVDDITDLKNSERIRQTYEENLKKLASELTLAEARERHNIATDLHDNLGQSLAITKITLAGLDKSSLKPEDRKDIKTIQSLINEVIDQTRSLTYDLSPPILYELGLLPAIKWNLDRIGKTHKFQTQFEGEDTVIKLKSDHEILLFRAINELFNNVIKHSRAEKIRVEIRKDKNYAYFVVEDDGIGFNIASLDDEIHEKQKFGYFSIRERIGYIKGSMEIHSHPGEGTKIVLTVPSS